MARFRKHGTKCDVCGKITNDKSGQYLRKNGRYGYIGPDNLEPNETFERCDDCREKEAKK